MRRWVRVWPNEQRHVGAVQGEQSITGARWWGCRLTGARWGVGCGPGGRGARTSDRELFREEHSAGRPLPTSGPAGRARARTRTKKGGLPWL